MRRNGRLTDFHWMDNSTIARLMGQFDCTLRVEGATPLTEGAINTNYLVKVAGHRDAFVLRLFPTGNDSWRKEQWIHGLLEGKVPIQRLHHLGQDDTAGGRPYAIYGYVVGISLQQALEVGFVPGANLVEDLAECLATIHSQSSPSPSSYPPLAEWYGMFLGETARDRLGHELTESIEGVLAASMDCLERVEAQQSLMHGDFRPENIVVDNGRLACILDWEFADTGHRVADLGQLFRNGGDFTSEAQSRFIEHYGETSVFPFPEDWKRLSKLRDLANLIQMIGNGNVMPTGFMELKRLITDSVRTLGI